MKVVLVAPLAPELVATVAAVDARLDVEYAWELFAPELVADWPAHTVDWYLPSSFQDVADSLEQRQRRDALLAEAEALCITFPFPVRIAARAPRLRFVHQLPAGVSNLVRGDLWHAQVPVTSGRGSGNTLAIAEWAIAAALSLLKDLPRAVAQRAVGRLDRSPFRGTSVAGKTLGVIGVGGIGLHVARLGAALGMHVLGTRRSTEPVAHVDQLFPPERLHDLLSASDVVVLSTQLTPETHHLLGRGAFAAMRRGAFLVNVARGELIDEIALLEALGTSQLGGFASDVYEGEFDHQPRPELLTFENVILTPHTSAQSEHPSRAALNIFCSNLRRCLAGEPLLNQVDWQRGY